MFIHGAQRMNPDDFSDPLTFHLTPQAGQCLPLSSKISQHLQDGLAYRFVHIHGFQMIPSDFGDPEFLRWATMMLTFKVLSEMNMACHEI